MSVLFLSMFSSVIEGLFCDCFLPVCTVLLGLSDSQNVELKLQMELCLFLIFFKDFIPIEFAVKK
jgi:hypothetical protein